MVNFILILLLIIVVSVIAISLISLSATISIYGGFIDSDKYYDIVLKQKEKGFSLNPYSNSILNIGNLPYISPTKTIFTKHHIDGFGIIWKWSKLSKLIDELYIEALTKQ